MVASANLAKNEFNYLFANLLFGMNTKGQSNPSCQERQPSRLRYNQIMLIKRPLTSKLKSFSFSSIKHN